MIEMIDTQPNPALEKLHDYYQPPPPSWTPQTTGWYVLFAAVGIFLLWLAFRLLHSWFRNRYRRQALKELAAARPDQFSGLLKRTALAAWPREKVASLSGDSWLKFLNTTATSDFILNAAGSRIEEISLRKTAISSEDEQAMRALAAEWIRRHRVQA